MDYIHLLSKRGKIVGVKNTEQKMTIVISSSLIFYFLHLVFAGTTALAFYYLANEKLSYTLYTTAFLIIVCIAIIKEQKAVFLKISYPNQGKINLNGYDIDYTKKTVRIFLTGMQNKWSVRRYNYILDIREDDEVLCSIRANYSNEVKVHKFIDNLIFDDDEIE